MNDMSGVQGQARTFTANDDADIPRYVSVVAAAVFLVVLFAIAIIGLRITQTALILSYAAGLVVLGIGWYFLVKRFPVISQALMRERTLLTAGTLACAIAYPFFATDPYQIHVMALGGIFALMGLGLNVTIGFAGLADFGYIAYYAIGAYASALFNVKLGLPFWLCLPLAGLVAACLSLLVAFPALRVKGHYLALVTLGFSFIVIQMITNLEKITGGTQGVFGIRAPNLFGYEFHTPLKLGTVTLPYQENFYYLVLLMLVLSAIVCSRLGRSRWGRVWAAMRNDEVATEAAGINLMKLKLLAFGTGASFGGIAGSLYAHMIGYIDPTTFRFIESIFLLAVVAVGNWRITGVIAAAVLFTVLPEKLRVFNEWRLFIFGFILLGVMLARGRRMISSRY